MLQDFILLLLFLDRNTNTSSSTSLLPAEGSTQADSSGQTTHPTLDVTGSYVQVTKLIVTLLTVHFVNMRAYYPI